MRTFNYKDENFKEEISGLMERPSYPESIENDVKQILKEVKSDGNKALVKFAKKFDNADIAENNLRVTQEEILKAEGLVSEKDKLAIKTALEHIKIFSENKIPKQWTFSPREGVTLGEKFEPIERIAVYIPGGTAPLVSTVLHTAGIAKTAGVKEIVAVTPPNPNGEIHPAILFAMKEAGVTEIYRLGGVYGIAAMAYGTESIDKVNKIVGPGNAFVTAAKKLVYGEVAIDMIAGPSEIMIIADKNANPKFIAADMLSQAEHGSGFEQAVLVCDSDEIISSVEKKILLQSKQLSRQEPIQKVLENGIFFIKVKDMKHAAEIANLYAAEHLEIMTANPDDVAKNIKSAGAIFLGEWTPEPLGDFVAGPSHVLPTATTAKFFNGLTVESFFKRTSLLKYDKPALKKELEYIKSIADLEGLDAHKNSAVIRFDS